MVFIKRSQGSLCSVNVAIQTRALPSKVRVVGSNLLPGTGSFFSSCLFLHFFPSFLTLHVYLGVCASMGRVLRVYLAGLLTKTSTINIPLVVYLAYGSTANFRFRGPSA